MFQKSLFFPKDAEQSESELEERIHEALLASRDDVDIRFTYEGQQEKNSGVCVHTWIDLLDERAAVQLVFDTLMQSRYVLVMSENASDGQAIVEALSKRFRFLTIAELIAAAERMGEDPDALTQLGMALSDQSVPRARELVISALSNLDPEVRNSGAVAASFLRDGALVPALRSAIEIEPDEGVRRVMVWASDLCAKS